MTGSHMWEANTPGPSQEGGLLGLSVHHTGPEGLPSTGGPGSQLSSTLPPGTPCRGDRGGGQTAREGTLRQRV